MRRKGFKSLAIVAAASLLFAGCDLLKDVDYTVTPDPLELRGDSVRIQVDVTIPEKSLNKKAYVEVQPMLGSHALKPITIVGEKATANGTVIPYKAGGQIVYKDVIAYAPDMETADLTVQGTIYKKGKEKGKLEQTKIADATIITQKLVEKDFKVIIAKDQFERVTHEQQTATINYLQGSPNVRSSEKREEDVKDLGSFLTEAQENPKMKITGISIEGHASIEGEEDENNTLSTDRANTAKETVMGIAADNDVANEYAQEAANYTTAGLGEDFKGFKKSLEASDMKEGDKDRILRILEMQNSPKAREQAIRDLSTYLFLNKNIFPYQRRSDILVSYDLTGYTNEELKELSKTNLDTLNLEEILFTATLTDDLNEKMRLFKAAESRYAEDYRPANNVGAIYYMQNKLSQAKTQFEKANGIKENAVSKNNLAAIAGVNGDRQKAKDLLSEAGSGNKVSYNKGILAIQDGRYDDAVSDFGSEASFNKALVQLLNDNVTEAKKTINDSDAAETAKGYYLKAIIAAHEENLQEIVSNLSSAFAKDASLKEKAATDREFIDYVEDASFSTAIK